MWPSAPGRIDGNTHSPGPSGDAWPSARRRSRIAASCRVTGSSRGVPALVLSTRKTSAAMSTRSRLSASTSRSRMPV